MYIVQELLLWLKDFNWAFLKNFFAAEQEKKKLKEIEA